MKFTRRDLEEKLGFRNEERKLIMKFQRELPILTEDGEGFCVDARKLHEQLKVKMKYADWIKARLLDVIAELKEDYIEQWEKDNVPFEKNVDYSPQKMVSLGYLKEFYITLDTAKEISMVAGIKGGRTNKELKEKSKLTRKYFILMEKALKEMIEWQRIRQPEKESYKLMQKELDKYFQRNFNRRPKFYDYANEADYLNMICLGATAKEILAYFETKDKQTREHLRKEFNMYLSKIQELNIMYLKMNIHKEQRYELIKQGFKVTYPFASFVMANKNKAI